MLTIESQLSRHIFDCDLTDFNYSLSQLGNNLIVRHCLLIFAHVINKYNQKRLTNKIVNYRCSKIIGLWSIHICIYLSLIRVDCYFSSNISKYSGLKLDCFKMLAHQMRTVWLHNLVLILLKLHSLFIEFFSSFRFHC